MGLSVAPSMQDPLVQVAIVADALVPLRVRVGIKADDRAAAEHQRRCGAWFGRSLLPSSVSSEEHFRPSCPPPPKRRNKIHVRDTLPSQAKVHNTLASLRAG